MRKTFFGLGGRCRVGESGPPTRAVPASAGLRIFVHEQGCNDRSLSVVNSPSAAGSWVDIVGCGLLTRRNSKGLASCGGAGAHGASRPVGMLAQLMCWTNAARAGGFPAAIEVAVCRG